MPGPRRAPREEGDYYKTPEPLVRAYLRQWKPRGFAPATILEPCAGDGVFIDPLLARFPGARVDAYDISPRGDARVQRREFFLEPTEERYDLIITNPPFVHALAFAQHALTLLNPGGYYVALLRINFLYSKKRRRFVQEYLPDTYTIPQRQRFKGEAFGTDWSDHAFFVWKLEWRGRRAARLRVLEVP